MHAVTPQSIAADIIDLYTTHGGNEYAGEKVTQLEHMVQAAQLARQGGYDDEMILAAFLHDIGHICVSAYVNNTMGDFGIINHEKIGAQFLRKRGFSERIARLVENHVSAKRYLTFKYPEYFNISNNILLYAQWTQEKYTVTYDANVTSLYNENIITNQNANTTINRTILIPNTVIVPYDCNYYTYNDIVTVSTQIPSIDNYIFNGWFSDPNNCASELGTTFIITSNTILYAQWSQRLYFTLSLDLNLPTVVRYPSFTYLYPGTIPDSTYLDGTLINLPILNNILSDYLGTTTLLYTFTGWYYENLGPYNNMANPPYPPFTPINSPISINNNIKLYAGWLTVN